MKKLKDESFNGIKIKFTRQDKHIYAVAYGYGNMGSGRTKKIALWDAKNNIRYKQARGNLPR